MRRFIFIYALCSVYCPSFCDYQQFFEIVEREHPRKANLLTDFRHLQYLNPVKVISRKPNFRRFGSENAYTLFPPVESRRVGVPDSPYFPLEKNIEAKSRVKKVIADSALRYKRSADFNSSNVQATDAVPKLNESVPNLNSTTVTSDDKHVILRRDTKVAQKPAAQKANKRTAKGRSVTRKKKNGAAIISNKNAKNSNKKAAPARKGVHRQNNKNKSIKRKAPAGNVTDFSKSARRIIAGRDTDIAKFPYVISIQKDGQHWCAGAILNPAMFISTANCFWKGERVSRMTIRAGSSYADRGGVEARIAEIMKHPGWSIRSNPDNDVAMGMLDRPLRFSDSLHSVDLPNHAMTPPFQDVWVTSWGAVTQDGFYETKKNQILQFYQAPIVNRHLCNEITKRFGILITPNFFCLEQTGKTAPCTADTGAPAVSDGVLWGLASWGIRKKCGTERYPAVFTSIASPSNLFFITNATRYLQTDLRLSPFLDKVRPNDPTVDPEVMARFRKTTGTGNTTKIYQEEQDVEATTANK